MADHGMGGVAMSQEPISLFFQTAQERDRIRDRKDAGLPRPWTDDPILARYHFTNVRREDDWTTRWLIENWYSPNREQDWGLLVFNAGVARFINYAETLSEVGFITDYDPARLLALLNARKARGEQTIAIAYRGAGYKRLCQYLSALWVARHRIARVARDVGTLAAVTVAIDKINGFGPFRAFQTALDLTYTPVLRAAPDRETFAMLGAGSVDGLDIVFGRPHRRQTHISKKRQALGLTEMRWLRLEAAKRNIAMPTVADVEHWLCEFSKYWNVRLGKRPRRLYRSRDRPKI
jgi:hypothetical protein